MFIVILTSPPHLLLPLSAFLSLKQSQDIHVDFSAFPRDLSALLASCQQALGDGSNPRFACQLRQNNTLLCIVESTSFKTITHLALQCVAGWIGVTTLSVSLLNTVFFRLQPADDALLKHHLTQCLHSAQTECSALREEAARAAEMVATTEAVSGRVISRWWSLHSRFPLHLKDLRAQLLQRENALQQLTSESEAVLQQLRRAHDSDVAEYSARIAALQQKIEVCKICGGQLSVPCLRD